MRSSIHARTPNTHSSMSSENPFTHAELYYYPSIMSLLSFGLVNLLFAALFDAFFSSVFALLNVVVLLEYINLHGDKLTRREVSLLWQSPKFSYSYCFSAFITTNRIFWQLQQTLNSISVLFLKTLHLVDNAVDPILKRRMDCCQVCSKTTVKKICKR